MGAITNEEQHQKDVAELSTMAETMPVIKRHCGHHFGNSFCTIIIDIENVQRDIDAGEVKESTKNAMHRIRKALEHYYEDLCEIGFISCPR